MKKFILSILCLAAMSVSAEKLHVAYLLPNGTSYNAETGEFSGFDAEEVDGVAQNPELNAAEWFRASYVAKEEPVGKFVTANEFTNMIFSEGAADFRALWIHLDRVTDKSAEEVMVELYGEEFGMALAYYAIDGGNVLLSKQATYLIGDMGRCTYPEFNGMNYAGADREEELKWHVSTNFAERENAGHYLYCRHNGEDANNIEMTFMPSHVQNTDHNCGWTAAMMDMENNSDYETLAGWEAAMHARVLGTWGGCTDMPYAGIVEFFPYEMSTSISTVRYQGTVLCIGLAAYMWHSNNSGWGADDVRHMTSCAIEYLAWNEPKGVGENEGEDMDVVLAKEFFFPSEINNDSRTLHPVVENMQASYEVESDVASIVDDQLVFSAEGTATLYITLYEGRQLMPWTQGWYNYVREITYVAPTASAIENNADAHSIKMMQDGQMVIMKNGVRYNALGQQF